jgi:hypothetical protein
VYHLSCVAFLIEQWKHKPDEHQVKDSTVEFAPELPCKIHLIPREIASIVVAYDTLHKSKQFRYKIPIHPTILSALYNMPQLSSELEKHKLCLSQSEKYDERYFEKNNLEDPPKLLVL